MIGSRILHYEIEEKLGEGGMGEVYLATDTKLDRAVALKFLPDFLARDPEFRARFQHEARALAALHHPNIVAIHDLVEHEGRMFIVMEAVSGETLDRLVRRGEISLSQAIDIVDQVCDGLQEAHDSGIVHRDIKPSNIVLDARGRARILDFGLSKSRKAGDLTKSGATVGTLSYVSPEQLSGHRVDQRTDLYSLGVVLYEMVTGRTPFRGEFEEAIRYSILNDTAEPLARYKADVPDELQRIQTKLLAKDPDVRYQSAADLQADLTQFERTSGSTLSGLSGPISARGRRTRRILWTSCAAALALVLWFFRPWGGLLRSNHEAPAAENLLMVTYFENLADPQDAGNLGEITANLLIADLSESPHLQVISSQRLFDLSRQLGAQKSGSTGREMSTRIAREAGAQWMLLGTIVREQPTLAFSSQLVDVATGNAVASQRVTAGDGEDVFPLVDRLASEVRADLPSQAVGSPDADRGLASMTTKSEAAYRHYVAGMRLLFQYATEAASVEFRQARSLDSTFAMVHLRLATLDFLRRRGTIFWGDLDRAVRNQDHATTMERMYIEAFRLTQAGLYEEAAAQWKAAANRFPHEKEIYLFLGGLELFLRASPDRAQQAFLRALEIDSSYGLAYNYLGYTYAAQRNWAEAHAAIARYIAFSPGEPNPYDSQGDVYALQGELDSAIAAYAKSLRIEEGLQLALPPCQSCGDLGDMWLYMAKFDRAQAAFRKLLVSPLPERRLEGRLLMAVIPAVQGQFKAAVTMLDQAFIADSLEFGRWAGLELLRMKTEILMLRGHADSALTQIDHALEIAPNTGQEFYWLPQRIRCLVRLGKDQEAARDLANLQDLFRAREPGVLKPASAAQAWMSLEQGRPDDAVPAFEAALAKRVNSSGNYHVIQYELAHAYLQAGRIGEAIRLYEELLATYSPDLSYHMMYRALAQYELGLAYEQSGERSRAVEAYQQFLAAWSAADADLPQPADARARISKLTP